MHNVMRRRAILGGGAYKQRVLSLSPLAYWPLSDLSGTAAVELVGGNNGAYTGVDLAQSQPPFVAPYFDGSADFMTPYSAWLNTNWNRSEYTISTWAKPVNASIWTDGAVYTVVRVVTASSQDYFYIQKTATNGQVALATGLSTTTKQVLVASQSWTAWALLTITHSKAGDAVKAYINGAQVGTTQTGLGNSSGNAIVNTTCHVGSANATPVQVWNGWLAHAAVWNRALSTDEVANLYAWGL